MVHKRAVRQRCCQQISDGRADEGIHVVVRAEWALEGARQRRHLGARHLYRARLGDVLGALWRRGCGYLRHCAAGMQMPFAMLCWWSSGCRWRVRALAGAGALAGAVVVSACVPIGVCAANGAGGAMEMMIILLLFLQKQNLAFAVYQFGSVLSLPD